MATAGIEASVDEERQENSEVEELTFEDVRLLLAAHALLGDAQLLRRSLVQVFERNGQRLDYAQGSGPRVTGESRKTTAMEAERRVRESQYDMT